MKLKSKIIILILISLLLSLPITSFFQFSNLSFHKWLKINPSLFLLFSIFIFYLGSHFIFKIDKLYDFIYKKRYGIALIILTILVLGKLNGSSIGAWQNRVDTSKELSNNTIIGVNREIRSDEWLVNTPFALSQEYNDYQYYSNLPRSTKTDMFSTIFVPVKDILIITRPFNIGYLLLGEEYGLSFYWYGRLLALLLVTFEFMMLITKKKKLLSLAGAFLLTGSPLVSWFYSNYIVDLLISGQLCLLIFNHFLETKSKKRKIIDSILLGFAFSYFIFCMYPAWQIPLGYLFLSFIIWFVVKNFKNNHHIKDYLYLFIPGVIVIILFLRYYLLSKDTLQIIMQTVYPGKREITSGGASILHFTYPLSIFFPIADYKNPCEASGIFSLFPLPIIVSIISFIQAKRKKEKDSTNLLILLLTIASLLLTIYTIFPVPSILVKLSLLGMSTPERTVPIIGIICLYLLILTTSKLEWKENDKKVLLFLFSVVISFLLLKISILNNGWYITSKKFIIIIVLLSIIIYLYGNSKSTRNQTLFSLLLIGLGISNILGVNPIHVGTSIMHETSLAKEIQKIVKKEKNANWIGVNSFFLPNYIIANGGKSINATNIYPNLDLWHKLDSTKEQEDIYNRYSHINIVLTKDKTEFELVQNDVITLKLNEKDLEKLNVDYILSTEKIKSSYMKEIYHDKKSYLYQYTK